MIDADPAKVYAALREQAVKLLHLDASNLSALEDMQVNLTSVLMLEIDSLQSAQLSGKAIDVGKVADCVKILRSLLPAATVVTPSHDHEFDGALETFAKIIEQQAFAIDQREQHLDGVYKRENEQLKAELAVKNSVIASFGTLPAPSEPPPASERSNQPPLPPASSGVPPHYLRPTDDFNTTTDDGDRFRNNQ